MTPNSGEHNTKTKIKLSVDLRTVVLLLIAVIIIMLLIWKPWTTTGTSERTIEVTGETTVSATPDEFVFYPTYQFENADKSAALADMTKKSDEIVAKLKELGVEEKNIKTSSNGYDMPVLRDSDSTGKTAYNLQLTITVNSQELAQKVQDYLVTTTPTGSVSPQPNFSDAKRQELEATARDQATKDARAKAEQSSKNLGFSVGKVKSVSDGTGFSTTPYGRPAMPLEADTQSSLGIYPGENELPYSVTVVYYIK